MKILFLCKKRPSCYSGGFYGLSTSASLVIKSLNSSELECEIDFPIDANDIDRCIYKSKPNIVIIEALYVIPSKLKELTELYPNIKFVVRAHSIFVFLSGEGCAFSWLFDYIKNPKVQVSFNHLTFSKDMNELGCKNVYLPNIYVQDEQIDRRYNKFHDSIINIGNFGHLRILKNNLHQAMAAIKFADSISKKLRFHINAHIDDGSTNNVLKNLIALFDNSKHELVQHDWMPHKEFCRLVATMDVGMCVSLSESFCITAADFVNLNVPIIASKEIKFISRLFQCDNNTESMIRAIYVAYYGDKVNLQYLNKRLLDKHNQNAILEWRNFVSNQPQL